MVTEVGVAVVAEDAVLMEDDVDIDEAVLAKDDVVGPDEVVVVVLTEDAPDVPDVAVEAVTEDDDSGVPDEAVEAAVDPGVTVLADDVAAPVEAVLVEDAPDVPVEVAVDPGVTVLSDETDIVGVEAVERSVDKVMVDPPVVVVVEAADTVDEADDRVDGEGVGVDVDPVSPVTVTTVVTPVVAVLTAEAAELAVDPEVEVTVAVPVDVEVSTVGPTVTSPSDTFAPPVSSSTVSDSSSSSSRNDLFSLMAFGEAGVGGVSASFSSVGISSSSISHLIFLVVVGSVEGVVVGALVIVASPPVSEAGFVTISGVFVISLLWVASCRGVGEMLEGASVRRVDGVTVVATSGDSVELELTVVGFLLH